MSEVIEYYGARIEINRVYEDGSVNAKMFTERKDGSFTAGIFSKERYNQKLEDIKNRK